MTVKRQDEIKEAIWKEIKRYGKYMYLEGYNNAFWSMFNEGFDDKDKARMRGRNVEKPINELLDEL